ncbi:AvrD family protein [Streptomyces sp. NPDC057794]|uniref:AvrD family protein n=1 Tax=Streptomyces sp. NPDC057794 TaxID=3346251 RepID=UPI0036C164C1
MTTAAPLDTLGTVDDFLGARQERFFGEGFKRVHHSLTDLTVDDRGITGTAGLEIPGAWSRKGDSTQRPHLSTIDVMLYGARLAGLHAAHTRGLGPHTPFTVRSLTIKAGNKPQEEDLDTFAVSGRLLDTTGDGTTTMECRVGLLTVRVETTAGTGSPQPAPTRAGTVHYADADALPGPWNDAPFGTPHRDRRQLLTSVDVLPDASLARADLTLDPDGPATMVDLFVAALQLGQVLLYSLDGVARADSNTLWMRRTAIRPAPEAGAAGNRFEVRLREPRLLRGAQGTWRSAEIAADHAGLRLSCSVAHLLPA